MDGLAAFLISLLSWLPLVALRAWALEKIWNWYLPPTLGASEISFPAAVGISLIGGFLTLNTAKSTFADIEPAVVRACMRTITMSIAYPAAVGCAWLYLWIWPLP